MSCLSTTNAALWGYVHFVGDLIVGLMLDVLDKMNMKETRLIFEAEAGVGVRKHQTCDLTCPSCIFYAHSST
jgi:hypothetical protein